MLLIIFCYNVSNLSLIRVDMPADAPRSDLSMVPCSDRLDLSAAMSFGENLLPFVRQIGNSDDPSAEFGRLLGTSRRRQKFMDLLEAQHPRERYALGILLSA